MYMFIFLIYSNNNILTQKVDQKYNGVKLELARTLIKIIHLTSKQSYLHIIRPHSHENLKLDQIGVASNIDQNHSPRALDSGNSYQSIIWPN